MRTEVDSVSLNTSSTVRDRMNTPQDGLIARIADVSIWLHRHARGTGQQVPSERLSDTMPRTSKCSLTCKKRKMAFKMLYTGSQGHIGQGPLVVKEVECIQPGQ